MNETTNRPIKWPLRRALVDAVRELVKRDGTIARKLLARTLGRPWPPTARSPKRQSAAQRARASEVLRAWWIDPANREAMQRMAAARRAAKAAATQPTEAERQETDE